MASLPPIIANQEDFEVFETPSKTGSSRLTPKKRNSDEENLPNGIHNTNERQMKRAKPNSTSMKSHFPALEEREDQETYDRPSYPVPPPSAPNNFNSVNNEHTRSTLKSPIKPTHRTPYKTPMKAFGASSSSAASVLVQRLVDNSHPHGPKAAAFTPVRGKTKIKKKEVQATNDGYASVAKLSAWLADDPTSTKKVRHIRKGRNVIAKSRRFEDDAEDVIIEENQISRGAVSDKKKWLRGAFHSEEKDVEFVPPPPRYAKSEVGAYRDCSWKPAGESYCRSEIVTDDAASSLSVSDKKDWLKNAFKKVDGGTPQKTQPSSKARSDILHCRGDRRDEITARAKKRWSERAARKLAEKSAVSNNVITTTIIDSSPPPDGERTGPPVLSAPFGMGSFVKEPEQPSAVEVDEDTTQLGFLAARKILLKRSKDNGNELHVISKVQRRKEKFEKMEREVRRRSGPKGLLRPSWGQATPSKGRPSDSYTRTFLEDIAPKKSFEELP